MLTISWLKGVSQINVAVEELDSMTQQNAGLVEETASASEEMANQAQELLAMMEKFKIRDELKTETYAAKHKELHLKSAQAKKVVPNSKSEKSQVEVSERKTQDKAQKGSIEEILTNEYSNGDKIVLKMNEANDKIVFEKVKSDQKQEESEKTVVTK